MIDGRLFYYDYRDQENHVLIQRVQMEQDTAKTVIKDGKCLIDYNRSGMPLLEIVTEAQFTNPENCKLVVREMQEMLATLGISEAKIDLGQMRVDVNVSIQGDTMHSERVEIKNVAGAKNIERAVEYEYKRHVAMLESGNKIAPETRRYDAAEGMTVLLRPKSEDPDYRFFQDPDLPRINVTNERISLAHKNLREIPFDFKRRFCDTFGMDVSDVKVMFKNPWSLELFSRIVWTLQVDPNVAFQWIYRHILGNCIKKDLDFRNIVLNHFGLKKLVDLLSLIKDSRISVANGKEIMMRIIDGDQRMPTEIADSLNFTGEVITSAEVKAAVDDILAKNQQIVQKIQKTGNMGPVMSLVGKVMDAVNRKGDPVVIQSLINDKIAQSIQTQDANKK